MRRGTFRAPGLVATLVTALALSLSLAPASSTAAEAERQVAKARADFPFLPRSCAKPADLVPQRAMRCPLTPFRPDAPTIVLWGDSHAFQMIPAIRSAMAGHRINLVAFLMGGCPVMDPQLDTPAEVQRASQCQLTGHKALRFIDNSRHSNRDVRVVVGNAWQLYDHLRRNGDVPYLGHDVTGGDEVARTATTATPRALRRLARAGVPADVIGQAPFVPAEPRTCAAGRLPYRCAVPRSMALKRYSAIKTELRRWMVGLDRTSRLIETYPRYCTSKVCQGRVDGINTFADDGHVSASMTATMGSYFEHTVEMLLRSRARR